MKELTDKLTRYTTAVGALLAVSAGVQANPHFGVITGADGNLILNHDLDRVYLDVNNDGLNDFLGLMFSSTTTSTSTFSGSTYTYTWLYKTALFGSLAGNGADEAIELDGPTSLMIKKFFLNDRIGGFANPYYYGAISQWSGLEGFGEPITPPAVGSPFSGAGDLGYIGLDLIKPGSNFYGWAQIQTDGEGNVQFINCALENRNEVPILAGNSTPVPLLPIASAAGLGLVGLMSALKRRKKNVTL